MITIEQIIESEKVFQGKQVSVEQLSGGYVNHTYKVACDAHTYCVRINNSRQAKYFRLDAVKEAEACHQASLMGIAPKVYNLDHAQQYLITDFFSGHLLSDEEARAPEIVKKYIGALKQIHENVKIGRKFSIFDQLDIFISGATACKVPFPDGVDRILEKVDQIRKARSDSGLLTNVFCHNDIWQNNIMFDGQSVCIIDWEFCGKGDGFFDFAHIANMINMTFEEEKYLLTTYFGYFQKELWDTLQQMKFISKVLNATWFLFHIGINEDENIKAMYTTYGNNEINAILQAL